MSKKTILRWALVIVVLAGLLAWFLCAPAKSNRPLAAVKLADGRILQIEALTYGTEHAVGTRSILAENFGPWLPERIRRAITPSSPFFEVHSRKPALVVWVNALNSNTGVPVDCQGIRVEFIDEHQDLFGEETSYWSGRPNFWRVGHEFHAFPRSQSTLTFRVTAMSSNETVQVRFPNPCVTRPSAWMGQPLPQRTNIGELDIVLASLELRTNGGPKQRWETPARYWEPAWELRRRGVPVTDWETPEWSATDATGNQGRFLGVHQPVLRFTVGFYPTATNLDPTVVELLTNLPSVNLTSVSSTNWVKIPARFGSQDVLLLGLVSAGTYIFENGLVVSNAPVSAGAVSGGARSGWVGHSRRVSPTQVQSWNSHYTPDPVIYVHAAALKNEQRLAVRLRDADGRYWPTTPEPQGNPQGILAFLVGELPADVHVVTAEVVVLKPVRATFDVEMKR